MADNEKKALRKSVIASRWEKQGDLSFVDEYDGVRIKCICGKDMNLHGSLETPEGTLVICPGSVIEITVYWPED